VNFGSKFDFVILTRQGSEKFYFRPGMKIRVLVLKLETQNFGKFFSEAKTKGGPFFHFKIPCYSLWGFAKVDFRKILHVGFFNKFLFRLIDGVVLSAVWGSAQQ